MRWSCIVLLGTAAVSGIAAAQAADPLAMTLQKSPQSMTDDELADAISKSIGPVAGIPRHDGLTGSIVTSSQHDSINGWAHVMTPGISYRFTRHFSADVSTPIFLYMQSTQSYYGTPRPPAGAPPGTPPVVTSFIRTVGRRGVPGDTVMAAHLEMPSFRMKAAGAFTNVFTLALSAPTGAVQDGVGAGRTTWNITSHLQSHSLLAPYLDLGVGTSSRLTNPRLQSSQTSAGTLVNFGVGLSKELPRASTLYLEAYEQLPVGHVTTFQTVPRGRPIVGQTGGLAEDNGIILSMDVPLAPRLTWSTFYNRGLRLHQDTVGFSFTVLLRRRPDPKNL